MESLARMSLQMIHDQDEQGICHKGTVVKASEWDLVHNLQEQESLLDKIPACVPRVQAGLSRGNHCSSD
jgi:hypothetical protein